jgi:hypothetical protein
MRSWISPGILIATWLLSVPCAPSSPVVGLAAQSDGGLQRLAGPLGPLPSAQDAFESIARRAAPGDVGASFRLATDDSDDGDDVIVQDEAPAARIDAGDGTAPALQPLGTLAPFGITLPAQRILSRRSPRGPPAF